MEGHLRPPEAKEALRPVDSPVAGVVLAAGAGRRMGRPKGLLSCQGEPLVRRAARVALAAGLRPVVVVLGAAAEEMQRAVRGMPVSVAHNPRWPQGMGTSVAVGVTALPAGVGAAIFLLVDQPFVTPALLRALVAEHRRTGAPVVAPAVHGQRTNPVLFAASLFPQLRRLRGDQGGRALFAQHPPRLLPWPDARLLEDWDAPEDLPPGCG